MKFSKTPAAALVVLLALGLAACDEHAPIREGTNAQNQALTQSKQKELSLASGTPTTKNGAASTTYAGTCTMYASNTPYDCELVVSQQMSIQHATNSTSPAETIQVPQLTATLRFPFLSNLDPNNYKSFVAAQKQYPELARPTGQIFVVSTTYGDYNPQTSSLVLPYTVSGYQAAGSFGEISGTLVNGVFTGEWQTAVDGKVGKLNLVKKLKP